MGLIWNQDGIALLYFTDRVVCEEYTAGDDVEHPLLLEARIFNQDGEYRAVRYSLADAEFIVRVRLDAGIQQEDYWDETHFLDIAAERETENGYTYTTTGGGHFTLPVAANKIQVRNYLKYREDTGLVYIDDWRIVGFLYEPTTGGEKENE